MRKWFVIAGIAVGVFIVLVVALNAFLGDYVKDQVVAQLQEKYGGDVEFRSLSVSVFPLIRVSGEGFLLRQKGREGEPPLISIDRLYARSAIWELLRSPRRVSQVRLDGLRITVARRRDQKSEPDEKPEKPKRGQRSTPVVVDRLFSDKAVVTILPKEAHKDPQIYRIHRLRMQSIWLDRPAPFQAVLTNATPPGEIETAGQFGPWHTEEPAQTPLAATYNFENANLGVFKGLAGRLSSKGKFKGVLERIEVDGETHTPDFMVDISGNKVPLHTKFHAIVDGTNGDTLLQPVHATFLRSSVVANGGVIKRPGARGRTVSLDVNVENARLEDLMRLGVKGKPPMNGRISFRTDFELPPGNVSISRRLRLDGRFGIAAARFSDFDVQEKVATLSKKGRGEPEEDSDPDGVVSNLAGRFKLADGVIGFSELSFGVPGAVVRLDGSYGLASEELDFEGTLQLDAKLSETTTGVKSFFLKLVDPLFRKKDKRTVLPIKVSGTREKPDFGLDTGRVLNGNGDK